MSAMPITATVIDVGRSSGSSVINEIVLQTPGNQLIVITGVSDTVAKFAAQHLYQPMTMTLEAE